MTDPGYRMFTAFCFFRGKLAERYVMNPASAAPPAPLQTSPVPLTRTSTAAARQVAQDLEAAFLAVMLKPMGAAATPDSFGGGMGEEQFSSFMVDEQARLLATRGGLGLSETIFRSIIGSGDSHGR